MNKQTKDPRGRPTKPLSQQLKPRTSLSLDDQDYDLFMKAKGLIEKQSGKMKDTDFLRKILMEGVHKILLL